MAKTAAAPAESWAAAPVAGAGLVGKAEVVEATGAAVLAGMVVLPTGYGTAAVVTGATLVSHVVGTSVVTGAVVTGAVVTGAVVAQLVAG